MKSSPKKPTAKTSNGSASADVDGALVKRLASILNDTGLTEIEYDTGALRIRVVKSATRETVVAAAPASVVSAPAAPQPILVSASGSDGIGLGPVDQTRVPVSIYPAGTTQCP